MGDVVRFPNARKKIAGVCEAPAPSATITILPVVRIQRGKVTPSHRLPTRRLSSSTRAPSSRR